MKVSVIIPVYNVEKYIGSAIRSVQNQTLQDLEIICVNDASPDRSADVIRRMALTDGRIRLFESTVNGGAAVARNTGMAHAQGEYLYFLDADDEIVPDALERLAEKADSHALDLIAFCAKFVYEDRRYEAAFSTNHSVFKGTYPDVLNGKELFILWMKYWDWIPAPSRFFYRRRFLEENGLCFPAGMLHEDEIFTFDVLMAAERTHILNEVLYLRRFRFNSAMTGSVTIRNVECCLQILQHAAACDAMRADEALRAAGAFYRKKITEETLKKYRAAGYTGAFLPCGRVPFLSVIIPVYNVEDYLAECIESVLSQDFTDFEVICVDDGSTDGSLSLLREYEKMDPRIRVIDGGSNRGQACARNTGLDAALGAYIYMMDADDLIEEGTFRLLHGFCEKDRPDVIGFENSQFTDDPAFIREAGSTLFSYQGREGLYSGRDAFITLVKEDMLSPSVPTYLIKRDLTERYGLRFTEGLPHEDVGFIFEVLLHAESVRLLHTPLYRRRFRAFSTVTGTFSQRRACGYLLSWRKAVENREYLMDRYGGDSEYLSACRKWIRDVLGRIRTLYLNSEAGGDALWPGLCPGIPEEAETLYLLLCETTTVPERARDILGESTCSLLEQLQEIYVCGSGQYMNRILDAAGSLNVVIRGVIVSQEDRKPKRSIRGFRVYTPEEVTDRESAVVLAVSRYRAEMVAGLLERYGFEKIIRVTF